VVKIGQLFVPCYMRNYISNDNEHRAVSVSFYSV